MMLWLFFSFFFFWEGENFFFLLFLGYRGIVHPPSDDGGTERTWFVPEHRPRKHFLSDQFKANKVSTLC